MKTLNIFLAVLILVLASSIQTQWQQVHGGSNQFLYKVANFNSNVIVATGESGLILRSSNGGNNWLQIPSGTNSTLGYLSTKGNTGLAAGSYGEDLIKTNDQGISWYAIDAPWYGSYHAASINVLSENTYYVVAVGYYNMNYNYLVYKSTNGGANWTNISNTFPSVSSVDIHFINESTGFMVAGTSVRKTTDGGLTWNLVSNVNHPLFGDSSIEFINENTGYLCANTYPAGNYTNRFLKSTNGGLNWSVQNLQSTLSIWNMDFLDANNGMIVADSGITFRTINGGLNWTIENTNYTNPWGLDDIVVTSANNAITVGSYSVIYKFTGLTGISQTNNNIPSDFTLSQNYPNPFNPSTSISFSIPAGSKVKLIVFNAAGQQVAELVNENLSAGTYEYQFNAGKLTSGIYFYRLTTDQFTDTKKMILVK